MSPGERLIFVMPASEDRRPGENSTKFINLKQVPLPKPKLSENK